MIHGVHGVHAATKIYIYIENSGVVICYLFGKPNSEKKIWTPGKSMDWEISQLSMIKACRTFLSKHQFFFSFLHFVEGVGG